MIEEEHVEAMIHLASKHHTSELMRLLYHTVKVPKDNLPVKHNQHLVIKYLMQERNDVRRTPAACGSEAHAHASVGSRTPPTTRSAVRPHRHSHTPSPPPPPPPPLHTPTNNQN